MDYGAIRDELAHRLEALDLVAVYDRVPDSVVVPSAAVIPGEPVVTYHAAGEGGLVGLSTSTFDIVLFAARFDSASGQGVLDEFMTTLPAAVEGDQSLGGEAEVVQVVEATNYGVVTVAGDTFLGVRFVTEVHAR